MRPSQFEAIRPNLQRAIDAITAKLEIAEEFEKEFERRAALPEGTAPKTELERPSHEQYREDVRANLGPPPKHEGAMQQYLTREEVLMRHPQATHPPIENAYLWRHPVAGAARALADCGWTTEAKAIDEELNGLPTGATGWLHPGIRDAQLNALRSGAERILKILTTCLEEAAPAVEPPSDGDKNGSIQGKTAIPSQSKPAKRKRGRNIETDPKVDERLADAWKTGRYKGYAALAAEKGISAKEVKLALDRHRKRK